MDFSKLFYVFIALCQTKPGYTLTKISKLIESSALMNESKYSMGPFVPLAMFVIILRRANLISKRNFLFQQMSGDAINLVIIESSG